MYDSRLQIFDITIMCFKDSSKFVLLLVSKL